MPNIRHSISIDASPERVFPLVSSGRGFSQWWAADVSEAGKDGILDLGFFNRATLYRLKPSRIAAPAEAEWLCVSGKEWNGTRISFKLTPSGAGTLLQFAHADWQADTDYKKIVVTAALISAVASVAYACMSMGPATYSFFRAISLVGLPGILAAAALSIALLGSHGGGPLGMLLVIATPVNFFIYLVIGVAARKLVALVKQKPAD